MNLKQAIANAILDTRKSLFVHLDPRVPGVIVPPYLKNQAHLVLEFGRNLHPIPVYHLTVNEHEISGTLSFSRSPFQCHIPWASVFALIDEDSYGRVFEEYMPKDLTLTSVRRTGPTDGSGGRARPRAPTLPVGWRVIEGGRQNPGGNAA